MRKLLVSMMMTCMIFAGILSPTFASSVEQPSLKSFVPKQLPNINLGNGNYAQVINASMLPNDSGNLMTISVKYVNQGNSAINTIDYWLRIRSTSKGNEKYSVNVIPSDANINRIPAKSSAIITYYSNVGADVKLGNILIEIIKWDFSRTDYEHVLGSVKPNADDYVVPSNYSYNIQLSGMQLGTSVSKAIVSKNEKYYKSTLIYNIKNNGNTSLTLPGLQYYILTSEGIMYQLQSNNNSDLKIEPMTNEELTLRGNIPNVVNEKGWKLVVALPATDNKLILPIASYLLPPSSQESGTDFLKEYTFTNIDGLYHVKVNSVTRTALDDKDLIIANLNITNKNKEPLPIPALTGKFMLDNTIEREVVVIQPNKVLAIQPNESISVYLYNEIPYTYEFKQLKLVLQQKIGENDKEDLLEITGSEVFSAIATLPIGEQYVINNVGNSSTYQLRGIKSFNSITSKMFTAQILVTNHEKRSAGIISFVGYFKTSDGNVFPATFTEIKDKMIPRGKALLEVSSTMPIGYNTEGATLIIGEAVATNDGEQAKANTAYVNPIEIKLGNELDAQNGIKDIDAYPYTLSISRIQSQILYGQDKVQIDFDYELVKDALVLSNSENKRIVIEIKDEKNNIAFTNEYSFEATEKDASFLIIGKHHGTFTAIDSDLIFKIQTMKNDFTFNVYEQIAPGYKYLLSTQSLRWFSTSD